MRYSRDRTRRASRVCWLGMLALVVAAGLSGCDDRRVGRRSRAVFYASGADLQSINPLIAVHPLAKAVQKHVLFMTLASYDTAFRAVPRLAAWQWNDAGDVVTFRLRSDVRWHDGPATTARDVEFTLRSARHPAVGYPRARDLASIRAIDVIDSVTLRVQFERRQPMFPDVFTDLAILPAHRFRDVAPEGLRTADFNRAPIGNGPFRFVEYRPNQRWVFARDDDFPTDLGFPQVERFVVVVVDEPTTKLAALTSGELDFAGISPAHASFVRADPDLAVNDYPIQFVYALIWNLRRPPFDDDRVRRGLTAAIDRRLIIDSHLYGFGTVAAGPVPPGHPWHVAVDDHPFDPETAVRLFEDAGLALPPGGRSRLSVDLLTVSGDAALEQMIQAQLDRVGVTVRIRQLELASFLARAQAPDRDYDALVIGIPGDFGLGYVQAMFDGTDPGPLAYAGYQRPAFNRAVERARSAETAGELAAAWRAVQHMLWADHPTTWLYHARGLQGVSRRIDGTAIDLRGELANIAQWRFVERSSER